MWGSEPLAYTAVTRSSLREQIVVRSSQKGRKRQEYKYKKDLLDAFITNHFDKSVFVKKEGKQGGKNYKRGETELSRV